MGEGDVFGSVWCPVKGAVLFLDGFSEGRAEVGRALAYFDAAFFHERHFFLSRALSAGDDGSCVSHASAWGGCLPGDEADNGFGDVFLDVVGGFVLSGSADLTDHADGLGAFVFLEQFEHINKAGPDDGVAADADTGGLPMPSAVSWPTVS